MNIIRKIAQPNKQTFTIPPIADFIQEYKKPNQIIIEPFPYPFEKDALEYLKSLPNNYADLVLLDPPYSQRQLKEAYNNIGGFHYEMNNSYWSNLGKEVFRILKPGGLCIKFGWNSSKINKNVEIINGMIVCHGSMHNDTIITVQKKMVFTLF